MRIQSFMLGSFMLAGLLACIPFAYTHADTFPIRVSVATDGTEANAVNTFPGISANGRYTIFKSFATNLVPNDINDTSDIFIHDFLNGTTKQVDISSAGTPANGASNVPAISENGQFSIFESTATNLVLGDTNDAQDVFVHDNITGTTTRISVASDGTQSNNASGDLSLSLSADGRYAAFSSYSSNLISNDMNGFDDVFVHDMLTGSTTRVSVSSQGSEGNGDSFDPYLSADGRFITYYSNASNLVEGDTNGFADVFHFDSVTGQTERINIASDGSEANNISTDIFNRAPLSTDGRYVAFRSRASNLVPNDTNNQNDIFVRDRLSNTTERISVATDGSEGIDGGPRHQPSITSDGRYVAFDSRAPNLVPHDGNGLGSNSFIHDRQTGETQMVDIAYDGSQSNGLGGPAFTQVLSADGKYIAFISDASNLISSDTNNVSDLFITKNPLIPNILPVINQVGNQTVDEGQTLQFTVSATDPDGDNVALSATGTPLGASFSTTTGQFSWTPTLSQSGVYIVTFIAADDGSPVATSSIDVQITVTDVQPLTLTTDADSFLRDGSPTRNEGANPHLFVQASGHNRAVIDFASTTVADYVAAHGISSATLVLTIADNGTGWSTSGRTIDAHPLLQTFVEGNGKDSGLPNGEATRGAGDGVTWDCADDTAIENASSNCSPKWNGGEFGTSTAAPALIVNNQTGELSWDVTQDVLNGAYSWLVKKSLEAQAGSVEFYSKEGATSTPSLSPRLILQP